MTDQPSPHIKKWPYHRNAEHQELNHCKRFALNVKNEEDNKEILYTLKMNTEVYLMAWLRTGQSQS